MPRSVHRAHRGRGHGRAVTVAAARTLRELGSSSVVVCCQSANAGAVATYRSAGMEPLAERLDLFRDAPDQPLAMESSSQL
ncbi:GNAT family N-acetyltransferase [Nonomuraea sp. NPDC003201]